MGPDNPWSPAWRPDESGDRLRAIRAARRGAIVAVLVYLPVALAAAVVAPAPFDLAIVAAAVGVPGGYVMDSFIGDSARFGGPFLRAGVNAAVGVVPLVVAAAALWVAVVRRLGPRPAGPRAAPPSSP